MEMITETTEMTVADLREALASSDIPDDFRVRVALVDGKTRRIVPNVRVRMVRGSPGAGILVLEGTTGW